MIKFYCDNCSKEADYLKEVKIPHYIINKNLSGYVDSNSNRVDGKTITLGFCIKCYNEAYKSMSKSFDAKLFESVNK